ncbi:MAG: GntR family transcriptional regulator [Propionibacteriaceae bacterium]|jgi:DNA-binding transcriptional regulator YhcF (GntR family)|nr:GntR family transcriptional regulator [Propionibacteriaceae bacterium]
MIIRLDPADPTPPYEQLRRQIASAIGLGTLAPGTRLPTVRQLAGDLGVANGTVMRAYSELESAGFVTSARGAGTRVSTPRPTSDPTDRLTLLTRAYIEQATALGATCAQILHSINQATTPDN